MGNNSMSDIILEEISIKQLNSIKLGERELKIGNKHLVRVKAHIKLLNLPDEAYKEFTVTYIVNLSIKKVIKTQFEGKITLQQGTNQRNAIQAYDQENQTYLDVMTVRSTKTENLYAIREMGTFLKMFVEQSRAMGTDTKIVQKFGSQHVLSYLSFIVKKKSCSTEKEDENSTFYVD